MKREAAFATSPVADDFAKLKVILVRWQQLGQSKRHRHTPLVVVVVTMRCEEVRMEKGPAGFGTARRSPSRTGSCERWRRQLTRLQASIDRRDTI